MEVVKIILSSVSSLIILFILIKIGGNKQMSELTMFDYILGISIGSIAAEMATELETPYKPLISMVVYAMISIGFSYATTKSLWLRRIVFGRSTVLIKDGKIYKGNLKKTHLDLNEFLMQCRSNGYFDISAIKTAIIEPNGKISILPYSNKRPVTAEDLKTVPANDDIFYNIIMDGKVLTKNLSCTGHDFKWLNNELKTRGINSIQNILLATLNQSGELNIFEDNNYSEKNDYFE